MAIGFEDGGSDGGTNEIIRYTLGFDHPVLRDERRRNAVQREVEDDKENYECGPVSGIELAEGNHATDWQCLNPSCRKGNSEGSFKKEIDVLLGKSDFVMGVKRAPFPNDEDQTWAAICKCEKCKGAPFWFHVEDVFAKRIKEKKFGGK